MDNKLLLAKSLCLLYRESLLPEKIDNSQELIRQVLENIKVAEINLSINKDRDILIALKQTILEMCENPLDHEYEKSDLLQRVKLNCMGDEALFDAISQGIDPEMSESTLKRSIINIRKQLNNHFKEQQIGDVLMKAAVQFRHEREKIKNVSNFLSEFSTQLDAFQLNKEVKDPAIISDINVQDVQQVANVFTNIKEESNGKGVLITGYQEINKMLGGYFRRGETWVIGALQHNFKTGFSLTIFKQLAIYNTPVLTDPKKKPLMVRISAEDSVSLNFQALYQSFKAEEGQSEINFNQLTDDEIAKYVTEKLSVRGYHTRFIHINPSLWTYKSICNKIIELEAEGYEIHCCMIDYLVKIPTTGCDQGTAGKDIINMYERIRNFMAA